MRPTRSVAQVAVFGSFMAYIYSAPPLKLKANGWQGTYALGSSYIALPWWCGHAMFNAGSLGFEEVVLTILYSIAGTRHRGVCPACKHEYDNDIEQECPSCGSSRPMVEA